MQAEIDEFHRKIRARALLIAVEWAGSADALGRMAGLDRQAAQKWTQRGYIPPLAALSLSLISGFPLGFGEMCPGVDVWTYAARRRCPHCDRHINPPDTKTGCSAILMRRSEAAARKLAAATPAVLEAKRQAQAAARKARYEARKARLS